MKRFELELEHHYKNRFVGRHRVPGHGGLIVLGQNRDADIRLLGEDVAGIHAYLEYHDGKWSITDAGSSHGTWVSKKPISSQAIDENLVVMIGGHQLKLEPKVIEHDVFSAEYLAKKPATGTNQYHQVIVLKNDQVIRTEMKDLSQPYHFWYEGRDHALPAPKAGVVNESLFGPFKVVQRIVAAESMKYGAADILSRLGSAEMRTPVMAGLLLIFVLLGLIVAIPHKPDEEMKDLKNQNKYTRMVFDADLMKKKRAEAKEMRKTMMASAPKPAEAPKNTLTTPTREKSQATKVVSKMKLEGLSSLLGKIAKRANSNGPTIVGFGKAADDTRAGPATVSAAGSLQGVATGSSGSTFKVSGVGTVGKGGGSGRSTAGIGGLATGNVGSGTVGILDEETEIDGGLDKEVIARVINGYLGEIRYCYERQLSADPDIYGKVQVKFTIDASGGVAEHRIGNTTLNSAMVEGCILRRLARWKFPKPKGGTQVLVSYPFMFKATN